MMNNYPSSTANYLMTRIWGIHLKWLTATTNEILKGIIKATKELIPTQVENLVQLLIESRKRRIFLIGMGRSGYVGRSFALRLMNLGYEVYVIGETITPAANKDDLTIAISGSGSTRIVLTAGATAKDIGMTLAVITSFEDSPLAKIADYVLLIRGREEDQVQTMDEDYYVVRQLLGRGTSAPYGTMFENNCMVILDGLIVELMNRFERQE
jgi:6-phospho-3-hexuloisomerase